MRNYKSEGIVLRRKNIGEADRILTVFTQKYGKIQVKAPGVRKITSRRSAHVELLNYSVLTLYKSFRSQLPIVVEAQTLENYTLIKKDLKKIGLAFYICELINSFCPENQENHKIFYLVKNTLFALENSSNSNFIVDNFEKELLGFLGFTPKLYQLQDRQFFMENILERRLKTKELLPYFIS